MALYLVKFGCYLQEEYIKVESDLSIEQLNDRAYGLSYEITESWVGSHGFADYDEDEIDEEDSMPGIIHEDIENTVDYYVVDWKDEYEMYSIGGQMETEVWE